MFRRGPGERFERRGAYRDARSRAQSPPSQLNLSGVGVSATLSARSSTAGTMTVTVSTLPCVTVSPKGRRQPTEEEVKRRANLAKKIDLQQYQS